MRYLMRVSVAICVSLGWSLAVAGGEQPLPSLTLQAELNKAEYFPYEEIDLLVTVANTGRTPLDIAAADANTAALEFEVVYAETGASAKGGGMAGIGPRGHPVPQWRRVEWKAPAKRPTAAQRSGKEQSGGKSPAPSRRRVIPQSGGIGPRRGGSRPDVLQPGEAAATHWQLLSWTGNLQPARYALRVVWTTNDTVIRTSWVPFAVVPFTAAEAEASEQYRGVLLGPSDRQAVERATGFLGRFRDSVFRLPVRRQLLANAVRTQSWELAAEVGRDLYADRDWLAYRWPTAYHLGLALHGLGLQQEFDLLLADLLPNEVDSIRWKLAQPPE